MLRNLWAYTKRIFKCQKGGFSILQMLGLEKKKPVITEPPKVPQSITAFPMGQTLSDIIQKALTEGRGIGFPQDFVDVTTSPLITQRRARWEEQELPFLSGQMSSRGLGRSTLAGREIGRAAQAKERDIDEILADAYYRQLQQEKSDRARYEALAQQFTGMESAQQRAATQDELARINRNLALQSDVDAINEQNLNRLIGGALAVGTAPFTGGTSLLGLPGIYSETSMALPMMWNQAFKAAEAREASPFVAGKGMFNRARALLRGPEQIGSMIGYRYGV